MLLSWNEIKIRAVAFTNEWKDEVGEDAEAKSFWDDFSRISGVKCLDARAKFPGSSLANLYDPNTHAAGISKGIPDVG